MPTAVCRQGEGSSVSLSPAAAAQKLARWQWLLPKQVHRPKTRSPLCWEAVTETEGVFVASAGSSRFQGPARSAQHPGTAHLGGGKPSGSWEGLRMLSARAQLGLVVSSLHKGQGTATGSHDGAVHAAGRSGRAHALACSL